VAEKLPIYASQTEISLGLEKYRRIIITAPTGSGKSTQVPQMLLDGGTLGSGEVVVLQPRRLPARLLARRVAEERHGEVGREVGYQIRFENVTSNATRIRYVTEGVLLRQMLEDPELRGVSAILFDEFHERHLYGDITLARALDLQETARHDLKIAVMSATLDTARLELYLGSCAVIESEGRMFPVEMRYASKPAYLEKRPVWEVAAEAFGDFVREGGEGDVLIFMPGGFEIAQTLEALRREEASRGFVLLPLHGELPPREQDEAVARYERRKVVVATNVAETSLTIDGIRCVIDSGMARIPRFDPYRGLNTLLVEKISRASADQRAGRAGRTAPGVCLRLWSEEEHGHRTAQETPEVKRLDLAEVVLTLKAAGVGDLRKFRWLEPPDEQALGRAEEMLMDLQALEKGSNSPKPEKENTSGYQITSLGRKMLAFPAHPRYARMLLAAQEHGCVYQACLMAALTQGRDLLLRRPPEEAARARDDLGAEDAASDFLMMMKSWKETLKNNFSVAACQRLGIHAATARQVGPIFQQFLESARREGLDIREKEAPPKALQKCVLIGFSDRVARRLDTATLRCELVHGRRGLLARESVVRQSPFLVACEVREVEGKDKNVQTVLSLATAIEKEWLVELFPGEITTTNRVFYDEATRRVYAEEQLRFRDLALGSRRSDRPPVDEAARLLATEVAAGRLVLDNWDEEVEQWIVRLNQLSDWCPELSLPPIGEDDRRHLIEQICYGALGFKELKDRPVKPTVESWLSENQRELLEKHAPARLRLANGRTAKVRYERGSAPHMELRIQELYDVITTPRIGMGRVPVLVHILTPSRRPVQITQDLAGFWREHYPRVKQELQRRYPKHEWR
jgi:ATP-dependent helicase HrpB